ncbi:hypothetical protein [Pseudoalteromonas ruthenica]|uniref:hypothetical protein n=1 Tax=Pseudoalteromonas ruthenica TaxID=151081 RepID=UPI001244A28C|nr:hypothetical protein [Pseudoalteromonas ruthenica]
MVAENPEYAIEEIDDWSKVNTTFHGLYLDRGKHNQLVIYPDSKKKNKFWAEIINSELLVTVYDGYLYELKKDCVKAL